MTKKKTRCDKLIRIEEVIYRLKISPEDFQNLQAKFELEIMYNENGKRCITKTDLQMLASNEIVRGLSKKYIKWYFERREKDEVLGANLNISERIKEKVTTFKEYLKIIQSIHCKYCDKIDFLNDETALAAAFFLHAKAISLLYTACFLIENHFWYSSLLLRPIDEAIDLAEYFISTQKSGKGQAQLRRWFRENDSPSHSECRKVASDFIGSSLGENNYLPHIESMVDSYQAKSKIVHPTFYDILYGILKPRTRDGEISFLDVDYEKTTNLRELYEITFIFEYSIWTTIQGLLFCFQHNLPLSQCDVKDLLNLHKEFEVRSDRGELL